MAKAETEIEISGDDQKCSGAAEGTGPAAPGARRSTAETLKAERRWPRHSAKPEPTSRWRQKDHVK